MKRRAIILIDTDDTVTGDSSMKGKMFGDQGMYIVTVRKDSLKPDGPLMGIAAHELGHVLATIYGTDPAQSDPRHKDGEAQMLSVLGPTPTQSSKMVAAEEEAWELAAQMVGKENLPTKDLDLGSYKDLVK